MKIIEEGNPKPWIGQKVQCKWCKTKFELTGADNEVVQFDVLSPTGIYWMCQKCLMFGSDEITTSKK